jgi:hypothetical protein
MSFAKKNHAAKKLPHLVLDDAHCHIKRFAIDRDGNSVAVDSASSRHPLPEKFPSAYQSVVGDQKRQANFSIARDYRQKA